MKKKIYAVVLVLILIPALMACKKDTSSLPSLDGQVSISDATLIKALQEALEKNEDTFTLQELNGVTELMIDCTDETELSELAYLSNLSYLSLSGCTQESLEILKELQTLEYLYLQDVEIDSLTVLPELPNLRVLSMDNTETSSLEGLDSFKMLGELYITGSIIEDATQYQDAINALSSCDIETVVQEDVSEINFIDAAVEEEIRNAILNFTEPITKEEMDMIDIMILTNPGVCALDDLVQCKNLKSLVLMNTQITNVLPILEMNALENVIIYTDKELDCSVLLEKKSIKNLCVNDEWLKGSK